MVPAPDGGDTPPESHARTDRQRVVRSVDPTPETLYLTRILVLEARLAERERALAEREHDLQHVIDRYETVLAARDEHALADGTTRSETCHAVTDGGHMSEANAASSEPRSESRAGRLAARLREELGLGRD
ncbi:MAG: hypothetical protein ABEJ85_01015 [Haloarculaceae archaeon]